MGCSFAVGPELPAVATLWLPKVRKMERLLRGIPVGVSSNGSLGIQQHVRTQAVDRKRQGVCVWEAATLVAGM